MSDISWGGLPLMLPSALCTTYLNHTKVIPERMIRVGARYRARKDLADNVRGYKDIKKGLQRRLTQIDHERKIAHYKLPERKDILEQNLKMASHDNDFPRPTRFFFKPSYGPKCLLFKHHIEIGNTEPRKESILGLCDVSKQICRSPSEVIKADPDYRRPTAQEILGIRDWTAEELRRERLGIRASK